MNKALKEQRDAELAKAEAIVKFAEDETRGSMTAAQQEDFDARMAEVKRLEGEIEAEERAFAARQALNTAKQYEVPAIAKTNGTGNDRPNVEVIEREQDKYKTGDALGAIVSARMRFGPWEHQRAIEWSRQTYGERSPQTRALQQTSFSSGGAFIPENFVGREFIERLTAKARVRGAGARSLPLVNGSATIPKLVTGATGYWQANEGDNSTKSEPTMGQVKLTEKKYTVLVPISNDLRRNSSLEVERIVSDDMVTVAANDEDTAFLKGTGLVGQPLGIYGWVTSTRRSNSAGVCPHRRPHREERAGHRQRPEREARVVHALPFHELHGLGSGRRQQQLRLPVAPESERRDARRRSGLPGSEHLDHPRWLVQRLRDLLRRDVRVLHRRLDGAGTRTHRERDVRRERHPALGREP